MRIGAYFLGLGIDQKSPSIYEIAIMILESTIQSSADHLSNSKALPSHLFKSLPIINNNEIVYWITCNILFGLKYVKA